MPSVQHGQVKKLGGGSWAYRYRDEHGARRQVGGFPTKGGGPDGARRRPRARQGRPTGL